MANGTAHHVAFSGVEFEPGSPHYVSGYAEAFRPMSQDSALSIVAAKLPHDVHIVRAKRVDSACYGVIYKSSLLGASAPPLGAYVRAYLYSGRSNSLYDSQLVKRAVVTTSGANTFPSC